MRAQPRYDDNPCRPRHFIPPCAPLPADEQAGRAIETGRSRLFITGAMFALAFATIGVRLVDVTLLKGAESKLARGGPHENYDACDARGREECGPGDILWRCYAAGGGARPELEQARCAKDGLQAPRILYGL